MLKKDKLKLFIRLNLIIIVTLYVSELTIFQHNSYQLLGLTVSLAINTIFQFILLIINANSQKSRDYHLIFNISNSIICIILIMLLSVNSTGFIVSYFFGTIAYNSLYYLFIKEKRIEGDLKTNENENYI